MIGDGGVPVIAAELAIAVIERRTGLALTNEAVMVSTGNVVNAGVEPPLGR